MFKRVLLSATLLFMLSNIKISARERFIQTPEIEAEVISAGLNVRTGPGVNFSVIKEISRGERVDILGRLNNWYLIQTSSGKVGVVYGDFLRITRFEEITTHEGYTNDSTCPSNTDEEVLFSITNKTRLEKGLTPFAWCENLNNIARLKAEDMVKHNYFGHYSPIFGTPFRMLRDMGIVHRGASENILSNKDMHAAHEMVLGSPPHKGNILSPRFNKMGVGIAESETYGKIIVQIFIQE